MTIINSFLYSLKTINDEMYWGVVKKRVNISSNDRMLADELSKSYIEDGWSFEDKIKVGKYYIFKLYKLEKLT
jgi:hypothetical protein